MLKVITDYTYALTVFEKYDQNRLTYHNTTEDEVCKIEYGINVLPIMPLWLYH